MSVRVVERVYVPTQLGVVLSIDVTAFGDESESVFPGRDVVEHFDEGIIDEHNADAQNIGVQNAYYVGCDDGRLRAGGSKAFEEVTRCQFSQL
jgi:hypothetical protein